MNKYIVLLLAVTCLVFAFSAGCTSESGSTAAPTPSQAPLKTMQKITTTKITTVKTTAVPLSISPEELSGNGDDVQSFTATGSGLAAFQMSYSGERNFAVWLQDSDGEKLDLLANTIGAYSGKKSYKLTPGKYYLDVTASGPWTVSILTP